MINQADENDISIAEDLNAYVSDAKLASKGGKWHQNKYVCNVTMKIPIDV